MAQGKTTLALMCLVAMVGTLVSWKTSHVPKRQSIPSDPSLSDTSDTNVRNLEGNEQAKVQFLFTMGLESDGGAHEFLGRVAKQSPMMQKLKEIGIAPGKLVDLHRLLYQYVPTIKKNTESPPQPGLWNAHCQPKLTKVKAADLRRQLVTTMSDIQTSVIAYYEQSGASEGQKHVVIPINTVLFDDVEEDLKNVEEKAGMITYPSSFRDQPCHRLDFPSLDLWYDACEEANVDCRHMFVSRPPRFELEAALTHLSGQSSKLNELALLHLYNTMLQVMADQMVQYAPQTLGCICLQQDDADTWKKMLKEIWGYTSGDDLEAVLQRSVESVPQKDLTPEELLEKLPSRHDPFLRSFLLVHDAARVACSEALSQV